MNMEEQLRAVVTQATTDGSLWHTIIHGNDKTMVPTENGNVPTVAKQMADVRAEVISNVTDYLGKCQTAKNETQQLKAETQAIKEQTATLKSETLALRNEVESFKNQSQDTFNMIATTTNASVSSIKNEGTTQIALVQSAVAEQVAEATNQANRAEQATSNKVNTDLSNITVATVYNKTHGYSKSSTTWWEKNNVTGLISQGGRVNVNVSSDFLVTFPKAYSTTPIMVLLTPFNQSTNSTSDTNYGAVAVNVSASGFYIRYVDSDSTGRRQGYVSWFAVGY